MFNSLSLTHPSQHWYSPSIGQGRKAGAPPPVKEVSISKEVFAMLDIAYRTR
jgi:hypothetical protein